VSLNEGPSCAEGAPGSNFWAKPKNFTPASRPFGAAGPRRKVTTYFDLLYHMNWVSGRYDAPFKRYRDFSIFQILKNDNVVPPVILKIHTNQTPFF